MQASIEESRPIQWKDHRLIQPRDTPFHPGLAITCIPRPGGASWHHEALVVPWMGAGKDTSPHSAEAGLDPMREVSSRPMLPALIALNPRATIKAKFKSGGRQGFNAY